MTPEERLSEDYSLLKQKYHELRTHTTEAITRRDVKLDGLREELKAAREALHAAEKKQHPEEKMLDAEMLPAQHRHLTEALAQRSFWEGVAKGRKDKIAALKLEQAYLRARLNRFDVDAALSALVAYGAGQTPTVAIPGIAEDDAPAWREAFVQMREAYLEAVDIGDKLVQMLQEQGAEDAPEITQGTPDTGTPPVAGTPTGVLE